MYKDKCFCKLEISYSYHDKLNKCFWHCKCSVNRLSKEQNYIFPSSGNDWTLYLDSILEKIFKHSEQLRDDLKMLNLTPQNRQRGDIKFGL